MYIVGGFDADQVEVFRGEVWDYAQSCCPEVKIDTAACDVDWGVDQQFRGGDMHGGIIVGE